MKYAKTLLLFSIVCCILFPAPSRAAEAPLTPEERAQLLAARAMYAQSLLLLSEGGDSFFVEPPVFKTLPLRAGIVRQSKLEGAVAWLNALRLAAGLPALTHSPELSEQAQHSVVLYTYRNANGLPDEPTPPPGLDPDFFVKTNQIPCAQQLHHGNIRDSITHALTESYEDRALCAERHDLLDPRYSHIGLGQDMEMAGGGALRIQARHMFAGDIDSDVELVAWPPKGVMAAEALPTGGVLRWSAQFLHNYAITAQTKVEVSCKSAEGHWQFGELLDGTNYAFAVMPELNRVSFLDSTMPLAPGETYAVTLRNVRRLATGELINYQYHTTVQSLAQAGLRGDANVDGVVNAADAAAILRHLVRLQTLTPQGLLNAKVTDGPAPVSAADAAKILRYLVRLELAL